MRATVNPGHLHGEVYPPPSKSITHRAYILAGLATGTKIKNLLESTDTAATKAVLTQMGAKFAVTKDGYISTAQIRQGAGQADCKNSGTTLRLLTSLATLFPEQTTLYGDQSLHKRPMMPLIAALEELGAGITHTNGLPPLTITHPVSSAEGHCTIAGNISSQYISSLLIMGAAREATTTIQITGDLVSRPYLDLTLSMLQERGALITEHANKFVVQGGQLKAQNIRVPADFSSIAFHAVAAALPSNSIRIHNIDIQYPQADANILNALRQMGANIQMGSELVVTGKHLTAINFNLNDSPDIFPILAVAATYAKGTTKLYGARHLKYKETDRIAAVTAMLTALGANITPTDEGAIIRGTGKLQGGVEIDSMGDHRIAMAAAIAAVGAEKPVSITNAECVAVSYPKFFEDLQRLGATITID